MCAPSDTIGRRTSASPRNFAQRIAAIPGVADAHLQQEVSAPEFFAQIDRARATQFGLTANSIALNLNTSLSSSEQVSPNFWTDPSNGTPYYLAVQTPEYRVSSLNELKNTPVTTFTAAGRNPVPGLLSNVATLKRDSVPTNANQANVQPVYEIYANAEGRDLGLISGDINKIVAEYQKQLSPGNRIEVIGQIDSMNAAFRDLAIGILFAAVFVYLLMVVNYQNWGDPFVVILALPATFCGIVTMLYVTSTTLSVPSLMGAIMAIGVASANSILLVTFAREQQLAGKRAFEAAISAGRTRIRPVLMTAAAMIVGMIPMAIGGAGRSRMRRWRARLSAACFLPPRRRCLSCRICSRCCARATTASLRMACSRRIRNERHSAASGTDAGVPLREKPRERGPTARDRRQPVPTKATRLSGGRVGGRRIAAAVRGIGDRLLAALHAARASDGDGRTAPRFRS